MKTAKNTTYTTIKKSHKRRQDFTTPVRIIDVRTVGGKENSEFSHLSFKQKSMEKAQFEFLVEFGQKDAFVSSKTIKLWVNDLNSKISENNKRDSLLKDFYLDLQKLFFKGKSFGALAGMSIYQLKLILFSFFLLNILSPF